MTSLVCNLGAFDTRELQRYGQYRQAIRAATRETRELPDGYGLHLGTDTFLEAAEWIVLEHRCCPFLNFKLELTDESDVWLSVTGPEGVKAFLGEAMRGTARSAVTLSRPRPAHHYQRHEARRERDGGHDMNRGSDAECVSDHAGEQGADRIAEVAPEAIHAETRRAP